MPESVLTPPAPEEGVASQKRRGGYYTPPEIAHFLAQWGIRSQSERVLEPSCGDGELLVAAGKRLQELGANPATLAHQIQGVEFAAQEAEKAKARLQKQGISGANALFTGDFFDFVTQAQGGVVRPFEVVLGNPPFLRSQTFPEEQRTRAFQIMQAAGLKPNRLTNAWVPFLVVASQCLTETGRLAMVIPAELLQVNYAAETRRFLAQHFRALTLLTFRRLVFAGIQQEVVLLLAERCPTTGEGIEVIELEDAQGLAAYLRQQREPTPHKTTLPTMEKWTQYYLEADEIDLLQIAKRHPDLGRFQDVGSVDVGVVTGRNAFFVLDAEQAEQGGLTEWTRPLVGRTAHLPGLELTQAEWEALRQAQGRCLLLDLPAVPSAELPAAAQAYLRYGEEQGVHQGYKCGRRPLWYIVPSLQVSDAFLYRQVNRYPKLVWNRAEALSTDTIHRVHYHQPKQAAQITASFLNVLTFAFAEVMGRSYGGGVLELEPNEADLLPVPFFPDLALDFVELDRLERTGEQETVLAITDQALLQERLNFDAADRRRFHSIWQKLSQRRLHRKRRR